MSLQSVERASRDSNARSCHDCGPAASFAGMPVSTKRSAIHRWDVSPKEARAIQDSLREAVSLSDRVDDLRIVAGVDVGFEDRGKTSRAAAVLLSFPELELLEHALVRQPTSFPYVPGFLSFREIPAIMTVLERLQGSPDLIICDGHGIAHPRRFGLACHLGVLLNLPTVGAAKSRFIGEYEEPGEARGDQSDLVDDGEVIGTVLRTRANVKPLFISPGHRVSLPTAVDLVLECCPKYRLPETTRWADHLASTSRGQVHGKGKAHWLKRGRALRTAWPKNESPPNTRCLPESRLRKGLRPRR